jgi:hypothetical protein
MIPTLIFSFARSISFILKDSKQQPGIIITKTIQFISSYADYFTFTFFRNQGRRPIEIIELFLFYVVRNES